MRRLFKSRDQRREGERQVDLHPLTLKFSIEDIESAFESSESKKEYMSTRGWFMRMSIFLSLIFGFASRTPGISLLSRNGGLLYFVQWFILRYVSSETWTRYRFWFHVGLKTSKLVMFMWSLNEWIFPGEGENIFIAAAQRSGVIMLFWNGWGTHLIFIEHILLHGITTGFVAFTLPSNVCVQLVSHRPDFQGWIFSIWETVSALFEVQLDSHVQQCDDNALQKCSILFLILVVLYGFALPSAIVWAAEIRSRHQFIEHMNENQRSDDIIHLSACWSAEVVFNNGKNRMNHFYPSGFSCRNHVHRSRHIYPSSPALFQ